ncbi:glycosyltransferase [Photobacterium kishitanii]|uniref:Glycosyltransferase 2-like domain-containing protein n=1 Tax=Photobacterium kishitanii TaxID=318456 RepID=A0A2T3KG58_9GAMM|nr:glycosyltransferase [Photobacterium kishitanii]PSU97727.1 hypothetical protein C9J27_15370 [Photobacterium kishitanii]
MISIIIPCFNISHFFISFKETVSKICSLSGFEVILINDGSTDNTRSLLETFCFQQCTVIHKDNGGVSSARNIGIENALGDYVLFLDADDTYNFDVLSSINIDERLDFYLFDFRIYDNGIEVDKNNNKRTDFTGMELYKNILLSKKKVLLGCFCINMKFLRMNNIVFHEDVFIGEDLNFIFNILEITDKYTISNEVLYKYIFLDGSAMNSRVSKKHFYGMMNIIVKSEVLSEYKKIYINRNLMYLIKKCLAFGVESSVDEKYLNNNLSHVASNKIGINKDASFITFLFNFLLRFRVVRFFLLKILLLK